MGSAYVDDHRFSLYQGGQWRDITAWVGSPEARDKLEALSVELTFSVLRNQLYDAGMPWPGVPAGEQTAGGQPREGGLFRGGPDCGAGRQRHRQRQRVVSHQEQDPAASVQRGSGRRHPADVRQGGDTGGGDPQAPTRLSEVWTGDAPETILQDILKICSAETGKQYKRRVKGGALYVTELPDTPMTAYHKPADNLAAFDITLAKGTVSGSDSMGELRNSVVLVGGGQTEVLGRGYNQASIDEYGLVQTVERLSGDENSAQARQRIRTLLDQNDRLTIERQVEEIWGADEVESGVLLRFQSNRFGVTGDQRVVGVTHRYGPTHLMSLTVQDPAQGRAADAKDTVEV